MTRGQLARLGDGATVGLIGEGGATLVLGVNSCEPGADMGQRVSEMTLNGKPIKQDRSYKVAR